MTLTLKPSKFVLGNPNEGLQLVSSRLEFSALDEQRFCFMLWTCCTKSFCTDVQFTVMLNKSKGQTWLGCSWESLCRAWFMLYSHYCVLGIPCLHGHSSQLILVGSQLYLWETQGKGACTFSKMHPHENHMELQHHIVPNAQGCHEGFMATSHFCKRVVWLWTQECLLFKHCPTSETG